MRSCGVIYLMRRTDKKSHVLSADFMIPPLTRPSRPSAVYRPSPFPAHFVHVG